MAAYADELEKMKTYDHKAIKEASGPLMKINQEIDQLPWPIQKPLKDKYDREFQPIQDRITTAEKKLRDQKKEKP